MRHLVYLLLVANLVYLGWNVFESRSVIETERPLPPLPAMVSPLVTLQEREAQESVMAEEPVMEDVSIIEDLTEEQPPGAGASVLCQALGPFMALDDLQAVETRLRDLGLQPTQRELQSKKLVGYWVYLPAMSPEEVQAVLAILKKHQDKEYYVGKKNFISLGTFGGMARAERRLKETREMGLDAVLQERFTSQSNWWLDIQSDGSAAEELNRLVEARSELQLVDLVCY
jgi:hypothetical protein